MKPTVEIESVILQRNMRALGIAAGKAIKAVVRECGALYLQSAANATPKAKTAKRRIVSGVARYRNGVFELAPNARPTAPGDQRRFWIRIPRQRRHSAVPRLATIDHFDGGNYWGFPTRADAADYTAITFRGLLQASFYGMLPAIQRQIPKKYANSSHLVAVPGIFAVGNNLNAAMPSLDLTAKARGIGGLERSIKPYAISRVNNRIPFIARKVKNGMQRYKDAGGLIWDNELKGYTEWFRTF